MPEETPQEEFRRTLDAIDDTLAVWGELSNTLSATLTQAGFIELVIPLGRVHRALLDSIRALQRALRMITPPEDADHLEAWLRAVLTTLPTEEE